MGLKQKKSKLIDLFSKIETKGRKHFLEESVSKFKNTTNNQPTKTKQKKSKLVDLFSKIETKGRKHFLIVGVGKFGSIMADQLTKLGQNVLIIDKSQERVNAMANRVNEALKIDALNESELESINFSQIDHCVISTGANNNDTLIITLNILRLYGKNNRKKITIKAYDDRQQTILSFMGIEKFIRSERNISRNEALRLVYSSVSNLIDVIEGFVCYQIQIRNLEVDGKTIQWLEDRYNNNIKIMFISKNEIKIPKRNTIITHMSSLVIASSTNLINDLSEYLTKKDDSN